MNSLPINSTYNTSNQIYFLGKDKNPNQIVVLATECVPYSVAGGLGSVTRDMTKAYKEHYPEKDLRIMLPYYNSLSKFNIIDTGIETHFNYGVRSSKAKLYKANNPKNEVPAYFIYFPEINALNKEYSMDDYALFEKYAAFSFASIALLEKMKNSKENFNPKILHTKDWHTTYAQFADTQRLEMKSVHELLNANSNFHGKVSPLAAALNCFSTAQIERLKSNKNFKKEIFTLIINNKSILLKNIKNKNLYYDINKLVNNPDALNIVLKNLAENYQKILYDKQNFYSHVELNNIVRKTFPEINWDENQDFNPTVNAIDKADAWFTISNAHFFELLSDPYFSSQSLYNMLRLNINKGSAILNRIDPDRYNPSNPEQIKYPYSIRTYKTGKKNNKDFLFEQFSKENISKKNFDKRIINSSENAKIYGWLDKKYKKYPLLVNISRFDTNQKGSDIALAMAKKILDNDGKANFIFGLPNINKLNPKMLEDFTKNVINNPKYNGRVVLIDAYVPINEYLAGADISVIPSRSETCGLVGYQSMRMGAVPVSSPVGSMKDCLITPEMDKEKAMGFLTPTHFSKSLDPVSELSNTIQKAINIYGSEEFDTMILNSMQYNSDWTLAVKQQNDLYEKILTGEKINNINLSDIDKNNLNLKILRQKDISKVPEADVLVLMAHPDDEIFFLPILKYIENGQSVQVVYAAKGEKGHYKNGAPSTKDNLTKHRESELLKSLNILGITRNPLKFDYPDLELCEKNNSKNLYKNFSDVIKQVKPKIILSFGPDGITSNFDHKKVGELAYNLAKENNIKAYQIAISPQRASVFKEITKNAETDAFDFLASTNAPIVAYIDVGDKKDVIRDSLATHNSQWSEKEVEALTEYYTNNPIELTSLDYYPPIKNPVNMWDIRRQEFQNKYGKEYTKIEGGVALKPESENYSINLYIADNGTNKEHLWAESPVFHELYNTEGALNILLKNIDNIKQIPMFKNIKYIDVVISNHFGKKFKVVIPEKEIYRLIDNCDNLYKNPEIFLKKYYKEYNDANINMYEIN